MRWLDALTALGLFLTGCSAPASHPPAQKSSTLLVMTGLPLFWGEAGATAVLNGEDKRATVIRALAEDWEVRAIDRVDGLPRPEAAILLLAQPRGLRPEEFVALDKWVREGGRAIIFADPMLLWPSQFPIGDPRRAPTMTILDPLFAHWGLVLDGPAEATDVVIDTSETTAIGIGVGTWRKDKGACAISRDERVADCTLENGRAILVADADILDLDTAPENEAAIKMLIRRVIK